MDCDLHIHTYFSDSLYSPEEVVKRAKEVRLSCIAIADHDAVAGIPIALEEGKKLGIEVVPCCELSCLMEGKDVHILAYYLDYEKQELKDFLLLVQQKRIERAQKIIGNLLSQGVKISFERVLELANQGAVGRPHIAQALLEEGYVSTVEEAFMKFIGYHCPAYVPKMEISPEEAISLIKKYKGIPVLAHPHSYSLEKVVYPLIQKGIMGLEVWHPDIEPPLTDFYLKLARKNGLLVTGGSDCHGGRKGKIFLGEIRVPYIYVEELKKVKRDWQ